VKAVIIAGGLGTRLRPLTNNTPKPIVPLANLPMIVRQLDLLVCHGINEVIINLHYLSHEIKKILGDGRKWGIKIYYSIENEPLGTAGAVKNAEQFFDEDPLIVFNGDVITDLNLTKLIGFHHQKQAVVTLALTEVEDPTAFGLILRDKDGRVTKFLEKPNWEQVIQAKTKAINAGTYIIDPKIFRDVPVGEPYSFERQLYPSLLEKGVRMFGYLSTAYWIDIGNPEKYKEVHQAILRGEVAVKIMGTRINNKVWLGEGTHPDATVKILGPCLLGNNVRLGRNTEIRDYVVLGDNVIVDEGSTLDRCVVWEGCKIGKGVHFVDCVLGRNCVIEDQSIIEHGVVLADNSVIKKGSRISL